MGMRRRLGSRLLAWSFVCAATPALGLEGRVVLTDGRPVPGAEVSLLGLPGLARTDAKGRFSWKPDPVPPFEALVVLPGGQTARPLRVESLPGEGPLVLIVDPAFQETVTVTAGGAPHVESPPAAGTTLLTAREIELRQPATLTQALESVAGVSSVSEGHAAVPAIRGLARGRTLILLDGARVTAERRVGPSATYLDPAVLEGVEVSRGPGAVAYGSDALGGVIHARTRGAQPGTGLAGRFVGTLGAGIPEKRASLELARGHGQGGVLLQGHYRELSDYSSPRGSVFNSGARDYGLRGRADQLVGPGLLSLRWQSDLGRDVERPRTNSREVRFYYPSEDSHRFAASYDGGRVAGFNRLGINAFLGSHALVTDQDRPAAAAQPRQVERAEVSAHDFHVRSFAERALGGARLEAGLDVNGRFGLEAREARLTEDGTGGLVARDASLAIEDAHRVDAGAYLSAAGAAGRSFDVTGGVRVDRVTTNNRAGFFGDRSTTHAAVSGFAALAVGPLRGLRLTIQVARGFRDPVLSDRYFRGPSGRGFITGNPDLDPETSLQFDLALRYGARRWRAAFYAYRYRIRDLVERFETELDSFFFRNRGRARLRGLELEVQAEPGAGFSLELAGHLVRGEALDDDTNLDDVPPATLTLRLTKRLARGFVQVRGALAGNDARPGPTEQLRPGYAVADALAGIRFSQRLELRLAARNLFDAAYRQSPDPRAALEPGRSWLATLTLSL